jgi:hypothetical protein
MTRRHTRPLAVTVALATAALIMSACSGSASHTGTPTRTGSRGMTVGYSACMRDHGVPNYPDPDSSGNLTKQGAQHLGVGEAQLEAAEAACHHLLPASTSLTPASFRQCVLAGDCPHTLVALALTEMRNFAACLRNRGLSQWPDPSLGPNGVPSFDLSGAGYSRAQASSAPIRRAQAMCHHELSDVGAVPVR